MHFLLDWFAFSFVYLYFLDFEGVTIKSLSIYQSIVLQILAYILNVSKTTQILWVFIVSFYIHPTFQNENI